MEEGLHSHAEMSGDIPLPDTYIRDEGPLPSERPYRPGDLLGRYRLLDEVGQGGMGVVFRAKDEDLGRDVALKLLHPRYAADERLALRVVHEGRALASLDHPNVVRVFDIGTHEGRVYVVMEFVPGVTLSRWWRDKSPKEILACLREAGRGLAAAHEAQITHRDFKPANVLVDPTGRPRVLDFGLARHQNSGFSRESQSVPVEDSANLENLTRSGLVVGTPPYMSPEALSGDAPDPRSDQYSFAVTLYEGLYGRRPIPGRTAQEMVDALSDTDPPLPRHPNVSWRVRRVLRRALAFESADRFPSMDSLLTALAGVPSRYVRRTVAGAAVAALTVTAGLTQFGDDGRSGLGAGWADRYDRERVAAALRGSAVEDQVLSVLDDFVETWPATRDAPACQAQASCLDCLARAANHFTQTTDRLATSLDPDATRSKLAGNLPDPARCASDPAHALQPRDPDRRQVFLRAELTLRSIRDQLQHAKPQTALTVLNQQGTALDDTEHPAIRAEASLLRGEALLSVLTYEHAAEPLQDAYDIARTYGDHELALQAALQLRAAHAYQGNFDEEERWYGLATELVGTSRDPLHIAEYDWVAARMLGRTGDTAASLARVQEIEASLEDEPRAFAQRARMVHFMAFSYLGSGDPDRAAAEAMRVDGILRPKGVDNSYEQRGALRILAQLASADGDVESALALNDAALDMLSRAEDIDPTEALQHAIVQADTHRRAGNVEDAMTWYAEAEVLANEPRSDPTLGFVASAHRGLLLLERGDWQGACDVYEPLADECSAQSGAAGYCSGVVTQNLSICRAELGRVEAARRGFNDAISLAITQKGPDSLDALLGRLGLAHLDLSTDELEAARDGFAFVWTHLEDDAAPKARADAGFGLAQALWRLGPSSPSTVDRALRYARSARDLYTRADADGDVETVDIWLATR